MLTTPDRNIDPAVFDSQLKALQVTDHYLINGKEAFTFENGQTGMVYVVTRENLADHWSHGDKLIAYTSPRIYALAGLFWLNQIGSA